jgi:hypothetical protein
MKSKDEPKRYTSPINWPAWVVRARESFLDWIARTESSSVLDPQTQHHSSISGKKIPEHMRRSLDRIKAAAMDEQGQYIQYARIRDLPAYLEFRNELSPSLRGFDPTSLASQADEKAFWINLYHALVLDAVIAFGVRRSVAEGWLGLMAFFRKAAYYVGGHRLSLNDIEHGILRRNAGHPLIPGPHFAACDFRRTWMLRNPDPRIHFALNCASRSCPPMQVYSADSLDDQLDLATRSFVDADAELDNARQNLSVSSLFRWYATDFGGRDGVISFLLNYLPSDERRVWLSAQQATVRLSYKPYDWRLNVSL